MNDLNKKILIFLFLIIFVAFCLMFMRNPFKITGFYDENSESYKVTKQIEKINGYPSSNQILILFKSNKYQNHDPRLFTQIHKIFKKIRHKDITIIYPEYNTAQISKTQKNVVYVNLIYKSKTPISHEQLVLLQKKVKNQKGLEVYWGGEAVFDQEVTKQTEKDLILADAIAIPVALLTLLIIFGSVIAAVLPIIMGGATALLTLVTLYFFGHIAELSVFTLNIAIMLGICLSLDYSLLIINRYREELAANNNLDTALTNTKKQAGRSVIYSGAVVFASLSALFFFPMNILFSVAMGGTVAIFFAVLMSSFFLPAFLGYIGLDINKWQVRNLNYDNSELSIAGKLAQYCVKKPKIIFCSIVTILLLTGIPIIKMVPGISDYKVFPKNSPSRAFYDEFTNAFSEEKLNPVTVLFTGQGLPYKVVGWIKQVKSLKNINSVTLLPVTKKNYLSLQIETKKISSNELDKLMLQISQVKVPKKISMGITGSKVAEIELLHSLKSTVHKALIWIFFVCFIILLILLRSIVLPLKAIFMNFMSLAACFGAMVLVFQLGSGHNILAFEPQGIVDASLLIIIFCALFGFSMDYEVFLLSRIREFYLVTNSTNQAVVLGIDRSFRVITSAALIVIVICAVFLTAKIVLVKAFGLGIAVAVSVDAFIIRLLLVPSFMAWIEKWNWYLPDFMSRR